MILSKLPAVIKTGLRATLGRPDDFVQSSIREAQTRAKGINASIPQSFCKASLPRLEEKKLSEPIVPIGKLTPGMKHWVIKVRVVKKTMVNLRTGRLMRIQLIDRDSKEIELALFKDVIDKFEPLLLQGEARLVT